MSAASARPGAPLAKVVQGELRGRAREGAELFAGIPYAAPPTGPRRFLPPQPAEGWSGVRDATRFGPAAPQRPGRGLTETPLAWDEDCLTLNVCTPAADDGARPVLVWIHGGGFRTGKGGIPWYDGTSFARRGDVVTVSLNYRLGALGFAHLPSLGGEPLASSGVNGLLDQIAALAWVRENVAAFGGDPARVTVAGESAGAMSVGTLLGCPAARGLFRGAIAQSGAAHHLHDAERAGEIGRAFADALGARSLADLQALPVEALLDAQSALEREFMRRAGAADPAGGLVFLPVVDGRVLPRPPLEAVRDGLSADVPLVVGTNRDETTLFDARDADEARLVRVAGRWLDDPEAAVATYRAARPGASPRELVTAITTDHMFRIPAVRLAEAHAEGGGRSWHYRFSWASRAFEGRLGATHALEIPFVFDNLARPGVDVFLGPGPLPRALADRMHWQWTRFVHDGAPGHDWPPYDPPRRAVLDFGARDRVVLDPDAGTRRLWDGRR